MLRVSNKILIFSLVLLTFSLAEEISSDINIKNAERTIDISSQIVKINVKLTIENVGKNPLKAFLFACSWSKLSYLSFKDASNKELRYSRTTVTGQPASIQFVKVDFRDPISAGATAVVNAELVFTNVLKPFPTEISQQEPQLVKFNWSLYYYSPYTVSSQRTIVLLGSKGIESFTKTKPFTQTENSITYGPYINIAPYSIKDLFVHYKNNAPFLTVSRLERTIEVSHWGNIAVEEIIKVHHSGAKLKGSFSRFDYQQDPHSGPASVKSYKTLLPASAADVYYRDTNGNISTSHMRVKKDAVEVDLRPRYPLFGGWKTHYTLGYNVPSYEYLFNHGSDYLLRMRIVDHVFDDMVVDELVTKIILPEGSSNFKLTTPYSVDRQPDSLHFTYLDTKGRPVITFVKENVIENHIQDFQLRYTFPRLLMLQEPLLLVGFLYALFLCVIIYVRLDFSIQKEQQHQKKE